jgi:hypothetical protein
MSLLDRYIAENNITGPRAAKSAADMMTRDAYIALIDPDHSRLAYQSWFTKHGAEDQALFAEFVNTYGAPVLTGRGAVGFDNLAAVDYTNGVGQGWAAMHAQLIAEANAPAYTGPQYFSSTPAGYVPPAPAPAPVIAPPSPLPSAGLAPVVGPTGSKAPGAVDVPRSGYVTPPAAYVDAPAYVDASGGIVVDGSQGVVAPSFAVAPPPWGKLALIAGAVALLMRRR